jgi:hypothetical protein
VRGITVVALLFTRYHIVGVNRSSVMTPPAYSKITFWCYGYNSGVKTSGYRGESENLLYRPCECVMVKYITLLWNCNISEVPLWTGFHQHWILIDGSFLDRPFASYIFMHLIVNVEFLQCVIHSDCNQHGCNYVKPLFFHDGVGG